MKRKLTKEEQDIDEKQLARHKENLLDLQSNYEYNVALLEKQNYLRDFDDRFREYLRIRKDKEDNMILEQINKEIENTKGHIELLKDQLKNGVEVKKIAGVN